MQKGQIFTSCDTRDTFQAAIAITTKYKKYKKKRVTDDFSKYLPEYMINLQTKHSELSTTAS